MYVYMSAGIYRDQKMVLDSLILGLLVVLRWLTWVLDSALGSFARAILTLSCCTISSLHNSHYIKLQALRKDTPPVAPLSFQVQLPCTGRGCWAAPTTISVILQIWFLWWVYYFSVFLSLVSHSLCYIRVYMCLYICVGMYIYVWRSEIHVGYLPFLRSGFTGSARLSKLQGSSCLWRQFWGHRHVSPFLSFYRGTGDPTSGPRAFTSSPWPTEHLLSPWETSLSQPPLLKLFWFPWHGFVLNFNYKILLEVIALCASFTEATPTALVLQRTLTLGLYFSAF